MGRRAPTWTCRRQQGGEVCGHVNPNRVQKCRRCGKRKPPRRRPAHMAALELPYEHYIEINGGEFCGVCGRPPTPGRRLDRDHDHLTGKPRGLLCGGPTGCNRSLDARKDADWFRAAARYLSR